MIIAPERKVPGKQLYSKKHWPATSDRRGGWGQRGEEGSVVERGRATVADKMGHANGILRRKTAGAALQFTPNVPVLIIVIPTEALDPALKLAWVRL